MTNMNYQILQTLLVLIFLLQTAGSVPELSPAGVGGSGSLRGSGLSQTNSMSFFLPLSAYTLKIIGWEGGPLIPAGCTLVHYSMHFIHYKIAIPHCTNSLGYIRNQQLVNNVQSLVRKKEQKQYLGE